MIPKVIFRGLGQIMLQENALSGVLLLAGICYGSMLMGIGTLLAAILGTTTAYLFKYNIQEIEKGLYGFSAALVGAAVFLFLKPDLISWLVLIVGAVGATLLQHFFIQKKIAAFTFPFVLVSWLILFGISTYTPQLLATPSSLAAATAASYLFPFRAFGQVIFQNSLISGILFFTAIVINAPVSGFYGLVGALISSGIAYYCLDAEVETIANGLWGYNAVLCAIVFAGKSFQNLKWAFISILMTVAIQFAMAEFHLAVLTFPFVLASFTTLLLKAKYSGRQQ